MMRRPFTISAREIAEALGGQRQADGSYMARCPAHADKTPSLAIKDGNKGFPVVHCHAGCTQETVIEALRDKGLWPEESEKAEKAKLSTAEQAREMFDRARPLDPNVAHPYFLARGIDSGRFPNLSKTLRLLANARHKDSGTVGPAIVAAVTDNDGFVTGIQRIFLTTDQTAKRPVAEPKMSLGSVKGNAIRIGPKSGTILVSEGLEDAMTGALAMDVALGAFAVAGNKMMPKLVLPAYATHVVILADNDASGREQAAKAACAFKAQGRSVSVAYPPEGAKDLNELVLGKTSDDLAVAYKAVRAAIENAGEVVEEPAQNSPGLPLLRNSKGEPLANHANLVTLLESDPLFANVFRYNVLALVVDVLKPIPRPIGKPAIPDGPHPRILTETDISRLLEYVQHARFNIASRDTIIHALEDLARRNSYHPFRDYLESLTWDSKARIDNLLFTYFGVKRDRERDQYHRLVGRFFLMGLAKRAFEPGCQNDYVPVLEGKQGRLKTKALEILGGEFFGGDPPEIHTKDFQQYLAGKMLIELAELDALRKAAVSFIKRFLTTKTDDYRPPYGRLFRKVPRSACFVGTTNEDDWSSDYTGARRFWPVAIGPIDLVPSAATATSSSPRPSPASDPASATGRAAKRKR
jgi:hypothetical protein